MSDNYGSGGSVWKGDFPETSSTSYLYRIDQSGNVTNFAVYDDKGFVTFRVDLVGDSHKGVSTPHIHYPDYNLDEKTGIKHFNGWLDDVYPWSP